MASSRTGTARWRRVRAERLKIDRDAGLTRCPICGVKLDWEHSMRPNSAEVDHIRPHSKGGQDVLENCQTICRLDNQRMGGRLAKKRPSIPAKVVELEVSPIWE